MPQTAKDQKQDFLIADDVALGAAFGPVGIIVGVLGGILGGLLGGLFGGPDLSKITDAVNNLSSSMVKMGNALMKFSWAVAQAVGAVFNLIKFLWGNVLGPLLKTIRGIVNQVDRVLKRVLQPIMDAMKAQRAALLDLYNRFLRPIILAIEKVRRLIHFLQLLHIHIFDGLDRTLGRIEGKLLAPIYRLLYRTNTLGNWISYILNARAFIYRGLLLGSMNENRGGAFSLLAGAPPLGIKAAPQISPSTPAPAVPFTFDMFSASTNTALVSAGTQFATDSPTRNLIACLTASVDLGAGSPVDDLLKCLRQSVSLQL